MDLPSQGNKHLKERALRMPKTEVGSANNSFKYMKITELLFALCLLKLSVLEYIHVVIFVLVFKSSFFSSFI